MENLYSVGSTSPSSVYGNVASAIKEIILKKFPNNFFNYTHISSEVAFRNMRRQFGSNTFNEIKKRRKPYLIIKPSYQVPSEDMFLYNIPLTKNTNDIEYGIDQRHLFNILKDIENNYTLKFKLNRDRLEYEIIITVPTQLMQFDIYKALLNQFTWDNTISYTRSLESLIPRSMINMIGKINNLDIDDINKNNIPLVLNRLNRFSKYPITYKIKNGSAQDEFFMYYTHNLMVTFSDLSLESVNKKNMTDDSYDITFRIVAEVNLPGLFLLMGNNENIFKTSVSLVVNNEYNDLKEFIPLYTLSNLYNTYPPTINGFVLYTTSIFNTETSSNKKEFLDISPLFESNMINIIQENAIYESNMNTLINLIIIKDNIPLVENTDWNINWQSLNLEIFNPDKYATYRLLVYLNMVHMNEKLEEIRENLSIDKSRL